MAFHLVLCVSILFSSHPADHEDRHWPTLLHFAAEFNLRQVCSELLLYPGMIHAACTENSEGLFPCQLAENKGFYAVQKQLMQFVEDSSKWKSDAHRNCKRKVQLSDIAWERFGSVQSLHQLSLFFLGGYDRMTDNSAEILFQPCLKEAIVSSSGVGKAVHSLVLSCCRGEYYFSIKYSCMISAGCPWASDFK